jgi:uncharacterized protein GlcG (DUF336 family)
MWRHYSGPDFSHGAATLHIKGELMTAVKLQDARRVISAAEKKAREIGQPMNIAVPDEGGNIVAHARMDNAWMQH